MLSPCIFLSSSSMSCPPVARGGSWSCTTLVSTTGADVLDLRLWRTHKRKSKTSAPVVETKVVQLQEPPRATGGQDMEELLRKMQGLNIQERAYALAVLSAHPPRYPAAASDCQGFEPPFAVPPPAVYAYQAPSSNRQSWPRPNESEPPLQLASNSPKPPKAGALPSLSLSVDLDAERQLPGPSAFDLDFSSLHPSRSRTFPHGLAGCSTPLHQLHMSCDSYLRPATRNNAYSF